MNQTMISLISGITGTLLIAIFAKVVKKSYLKLEDQKLVKKNVRVTILFKMAFVTAIIAFIFMSFPLIFLKLQDKNLKEILLGDLILVSSASFGVTWYFWELVRITKTEIELRKLNKST